MLDCKSFGSSMVLEPGLSLRVVLFGAQCDKQGVSISTSGQCLFQSQMDNRAGEVAQIPRITKLDTANTSGRKEPPFRTSLCVPAIHGL